MVDPTQLPSSEHIEQSRGVFAVIGYVLGVFGVGWAAHAYTKKQMKDLVAEVVAESIPKAVNSTVQDKITPINVVLASLQGVPSSINALQAAVDDLEERCDEVHRKEFITKSEIKDLQAQCVLHIWDRLMLDLEKRDRARDQQIHDKISTICSALSGVQYELRQLHETKFKDDHRIGPIDNRDKRP